jgi:hypothetical protein
MRDDPFTFGPEAERLANTDATERFPPLLAEIADYAADELKHIKPGLSAADRNRLGLRISARLAWEFGGVRYYWKPHPEQPRPR